MQHLSLSKDNIKECFYLFNIERCHTVVFIHSFIQNVSLPSNQVRISIFLDSLELASSKFKSMWVLSAKSYFSVTAGPGKGWLLISKCLNTLD